MKNKIKKTIDELFIEKKTILSKSESAKILGGNQELVSATSNAAFLTRTGLDGETKHGSWSDLDND